MKRVLRAVQNTGVIFLSAVIILMLLHMADMRETVRISSLLGLIAIAAATQLISAAMDYITIRPAPLHMLCELFAVEAEALGLGFALRLFDFGRPSYILADILLIALVYGIVVLYYFLSARYAAEEINRYIQNKTGN